MKRFIISTAACLALLPMFGAYDTPYYSDMATSSAIDPDWTVVDANADNTTWILDNSNNNLTTVTGAAAGVQYKYSNNNPGDDWIISPAINLEAGKTYKVKVWTKTSKGNENYTLYMSTSSDPEVMKTGTVVKDYASYCNQTWTQLNETVTITESGEYYFGFYEYSEKGKWNVYIRGFYVSEDVLSPAAVSDLTAVAGANRALSATVSWTLPTVDNEGNALTAAMDAVVVERDGSEVARLSGDATQFEDSAEHGLTSGYHTYSVYAIYNGHKGAAKSVTTGYVGPIDPIELPYSTDFNNASDLDIWSVYDVDNDFTSTGFFGWYQRTPNSLIGGVMEIQNSKQGAAQDDWAITPPLKIENAGIYTLYFKGANAQNYYMDLTIYYGNSDSPESMVNEICNITELPNQTNPHSSGKECSYNFVIATPGTYYIGFHAHGSAETPALIRIDDLSVTAGDQLTALPYTAESVSASPMLALPRGYIKVTTAPAVEVTYKVGDSETLLVDSIFKNMTATEASFLLSNAADITVEVSDQTPDMADAFKITEADGTLTAKVIYPTVSQSGDPLLEIESAKIYKDGVVIYEVEESIIPGTTAVYNIPWDEISLQDESAPVYELELSNMSGSSKTVNGYSTGVKTINSNYNSMRYSADEVTLGNAARIVVSDISGKVISRSYGTALSLRDLPRGIYIISANGYAPLKVVK